ncbi:MAG: hypothetical protein ACRDSL_15800 [Pseudonocardiaceae bacterium]
MLPADQPGKDAFINRYPGGCDAVLLHQPATTDTPGTGTLLVEVVAPLPTEELCALATELVASAEKRLEP